MVEDAKAQKNAVRSRDVCSLTSVDASQTELEGFRQCHIRDGTALVRYFAWLQDVLEQGEKWTEYDAAQVLESYRK